ncbi:hypothetical protein PB1_07407 [Bacillus methanolicus PB1]|uniref:Uncharacterized protein n=1 Tax=Bacillus methanolicus PB1 TaxID=997296 RepID=I3E0Z8_BACMT|nr:hypothetical protein PB1_07407 [Bacillus methanolicus PB1]
MYVTSWKEVDIFENWLINYEKWLINYGKWSIYPKIGSQSKLVHKKEQIKKQPAFLNGLQLIRDYIYS